MDEDRNNNVRQRLSDIEEEDRLSSLPDVIIISILSLLPINSAAATSVLSHRWRHLWTDVTRFDFWYKSGRCVDILHIIGQLTSPKLHTFDIRVDPHINISLEDWESCFALVCGRNVEEISVSYNLKDEVNVPACVFNCESIVALELDWFVIRSSELLDDSNIHLPRLKTLRLCVDEDSLKFILPLLQCCPFLEVLSLVIDGLVLSFVVRIFAPNLKSLMIEMVKTQHRNRFFIDAPKLDDLYISDSSSFYCFVNHPTQLHTAYIDFTFQKRGRVEDGMVSEDYFRHSVKFVQGMSNARKLKLESDIGMFTHLIFVNNQAMPIFCNIVCFNTALAYLNGWKDLLLFLYFVPNLKDLTVRMDNLSVGEHLNWCENYFVPDCFVSKLKTIRIRMLRGNDDEVKLLKYILKSAVVLEKLHLDVYIWDGCEEVRLGKEYKFCEAIFKLPRTSLTSEVVFSGSHIKTSSNAIVNGLLNCQIRFSI